MVIFAIQISKPKRPSAKVVFFLLQSTIHLCYTSTMETTRHNLYIPVELYEKIQYLAGKDLRSFNRECLFLLGQIVEQRRDDLVDFQQENKDEKD